MLLNSGLNASVFTGGFPSASSPAPAAASPQAGTIGQQAFGNMGGNSTGANTSLYALITGGAVSLGLLLFIYWSLPR